MSNAAWSDGERRRACRGLAVSLQKTCGELAGACKKLAEGLRRSLRRGLRGTCGKLAGRSCAGKRFELLKGMRSAAVPALPGVG